MERISFLSLPRTGANSPDSSLLLLQARPAQVAIRPRSRNKETGEHGGEQAHEGGVTRGMGSPEASDTTIFVVVGFFSEFAI
mmetsp:Transcript_21383/g.48353  ORF Transcript_21383/g.48353 Transcript_21383/m.48353 type:complete len:82 (-) Transcript_21383:3029-3274(-)|eukprot:752040-Hanusia_phi.AAC.6